MKKFLVIALALVSSTVFAHNHEGRHMVSLSGYESSSQAVRSFNYNHSNGGAAHNTTDSLALNYAYAVSHAWQLGGVYKSSKVEGTAKAETKSNTWGAFVIYNFAGKLSDTNFLAAKYTMANQEEKSTAGATTADDDTDTWSLEFGHRFSLGNLWSMNFNWAPSLEVGIADTNPKTGDDSSSTVVTLNILKVDVLF